MPQLIPPPQLLSLLQWFSPCFTQPSFAYFVNFVVCLIAAVGRCTSTTVYRTSAGDRHWTNYSRFLAHYRWSVRDLSQQLLLLLLHHCGLWRDDQGRRRLCLIIDETIVEKTSKRLFGVAWQRNTHGGLCRGTHVLGHYWLMLGVLLCVGGRSFCFPLAFRLYRQKKRCPADQYKTPCQLALELLHSLSWPQAPDLARTVVADAGFADKALLRWCAANDFVAIVRGRIDARVHDLYVRQPRPLRGRPRTWGERISLIEYARHEAHFTHTVRLYQQRTQMRVASLVGRHYASGLALRFVLVRAAGKDDMVLMSSDLSLTPREIAGLYADRFAIELTFRELKQHFGLGHCQARVPQAMLRHVHLSGIACALTQLLTLCPVRTGFGDLLRWTPTPWRRRHTPISVHETQLLLRLACQSGGAFRHVAGSTAHRGKVRPHRQTPPQPYTAAIKC